MRWLVDPLCQSEFNQRSRTSRIYVYIYACAHTCTHTHIYTYMNICIHMCIYGVAENRNWNIYMYVYICKHIHTHMYNKIKREIYYKELAYTIIRAGYTNLKPTAERKINMWYYLQSYFFSDIQPPLLSRASKYARIEWRAMCLQLQLSLAMIIRCNFHHDNVQVEF